MNGFTLSRPWLRFLPKGTDTLLGLIDTARAEGTAEPLTDLRKATADYEEAVRETAGHVAAREPFKFCDMTCPSAAVAVLRLARRTLLLADAVVAGLSSDEAGPEIVSHCLKRFLPDFDPGWLQAELVLELRGASEPIADCDLAAWLPDEVDEFIAVRSMFPKGWTIADEYPGMSYQERLDWLTGPSEDEKDSEPRHSPGFTCVKWLGVLYEFSPAQSRCVELLWSAWKNGTPTVHETFIQAELDTDSRIRDLFKGHPAWGTVIVSGGPKGTLRLSDERNF